jgi:hypothetical protein
MTVAGGEFNGVFLAFLSIGRRFGSPLPSEVALKLDAAGPGTYTSPTFAEVAQLV